ncbi:protein SRG1-like [Impatiens glandulifera]|uniref:protein SRG1-like n=1 Tax=Impatiens glandulifera TaxID=253017 RepID=UPI001FB1742A|nr:protein SRG1-like [Impatiens glandulifera]
MAHTIKVGYIHDVQELGNSKKTAIPERFVKDIDERQSLKNVNTSLSTSIPIIDLSKLLMKVNKDEFDIELLKLVASCEEWGFFQVVNHGIDLELLDNFEKVVMDFFKLPLEEKKKYPMLPGTIQGYGQAFVFSEEQKLDWCNMFALGVIPDSIRQPHLWPHEPVTFCETLEEYSKEVRKMIQKLLGFIAMSLGLNEDTFEKMFGESVQAVRLNYYPPCPRPDLVMGLTAHSDGSALTVLQLRKDDPLGLQILKDNKWVPVHYVPGALVINVGDTIEVLSNGKYKSVEHRAVANEERDRLSLVTFYAPSYDMELGPVEELVNESMPAKYKRYNHGEYSKNYVTSKLEGKKSLDFAKIK